jgi:hypothetical protein
MIHAMPTCDTFLWSVTGVYLWFTQRLQSELCNTNIAGILHSGGNFNWT